MEASIGVKLERFIAIMAAGTLCTHRQALLAVMGTDRFSEEAARIALAHLEWCSACRVEYAARVRAWRSGQLEREIASLLPLAPTVERMRSPRALWDALTEWIGRPATHDATLTGTQISVATRGAGTILAAKLAAMCIGGIALVGGGVYCLQGPLADHREAPQEVKVERPKPRPTRTPKPTPTATPTARPARATRPQAQTQEEAST